MVWSQILCVRKICRYCELTYIQPMATAQSSDNDNDWIHFYYNLAHMNHKIAISFILKVSYSTL